MRPISLCLVAVELDHVVKNGGIGTTNWLLIQGLQRYGFVEEAERVRDDTLSLLACPLPGGDDWWFCEYFNPTNGNAHGTVGFSWSAALALALTEPPPAPHAST
jgi:hypothetical protein